MTRLKRRPMQVVLRREVEVDGALPDAGPLRDVAHLDAVEVALREHGGRRREEPSSLVVTCHGND